MDKLTKKQKKFVKEYIKDENGTQAALKAYDTKDNPTARAIASENLTKPNIINAIKTIADSIPNELVIEKHIALLNKMEKKYDSEGNVISEEIDVQAVKAGVDMTYKLKGAYAPEKSVNLNLNGDIIPSEELEGLAKELNDIARNKTSNEGTGQPSDGTNPDIVDSEVQD